MTIDENCFIRRNVAVVCSVSASVTAHISEHAPIDKSAHLFGAIENSHQQAGGPPMTQIALKTAAHIFGADAGDRDRQRDEVVGQRVKLLGELVQRRLQK